MLSHTLDEQRIEGLDAIFSAIRKELFCDLRAKIGGEILAFELDEYRNSTVHECKDLCQSRDFLLAVRQIKLAKLFAIKFTKLFINSRHTHEGIIVKDHYLAVARELNVKLYSFSGLASTLKSLERILGHSSSVKSSVRIIAKKRFFFGALRSRTDEKQNIEQ
jgi:hypothetical protein